MLRRAKLLVVAVARAQRCAHIRDADVAFLGKALPADWRPRLNGSASPTRNKASRDVA